MESHWPVRNHISYIQNLGKDTGIEIQNLVNEIYRRCVSHQPGTPNFFVYDSHWNLLFQRFWVNQ